jgi:CRP-like cAMP-binding protein
MISPELLRRYPFFANFDDAQLKAIAMLADEVSYSKGETLFENDKPADALYLLISGDIELHYIVVDRDDPKLRKDFLVGEVNPGEIFGFSALIEPYIYTASALTSAPTRVIKIKGEGLRALCEVDPKICGLLMRQVAKVALSRLNDTRVQLAAARA